MVKSNKTPSYKTCKLPIKKIIVQNLRIFSYSHDSETFEKVQKIKTVRMLEI